MNDPKQPDDAGSEKSLSDTSVFDRRAMEDRQRKTMNKDLSASPEETTTPTEPTPKTLASPPTRPHARAAGPPKPTLKPVVPPAPQPGPKVVGPDDPVPGTNTSIVRLHLPRPPQSRPPAGPTKPAPQETSSSASDADKPDATQKPDKPIDTSTRYLIRTLKNLPKPPGK